MNHIVNTTQRGLDGLNDIPSSPQGAGVAGAVLGGEQHAN